MLQYQDPKTKGQVPLLRVKIQIPINMIKEAFQKNVKFFYPNLLLQKKQQMKCYCYLLQLPENCVSEM